MTEKYQILYAINGVSSLLLCLVSDRKLTFGVLAQEESLAE